MKNISSLIIVIFLYGIFIDHLYSQENQPDALYLKILKEYRLNTDGSVTFHYSQKLKLLSYFAFQRQYGETSVIYDPRYQNVKINYAFTTTSDGQNIPVPSNAINEVLPDFAANSPEYNYLRRVVIVHTGLERNAVINIDYELNTKAGYYPALMGNELIPSYSPVDEEVVVVKIPKAVRLKYKLLNSPVKPVSNVIGDTVIYRWTFNSVPAIIPESQLPSYSDYLPYLLFSSADDLRQVYRKFIEQDAFRNFTDKNMKNWVIELKKNSVSEIAFLLKLQEEIAVNMKTYNIPLNYSGYRLNDPEKVFYANGGTPLEKAALMCSLLSCVNIRAYTVLAAPAPSVDPEIGNLNVFDEVYVRVYTDPEKTIYFPVDKTVNKNLKFSLSGKKLIPVLADLKILDITTENSLDNNISLSGNYKMDENANIKGISTFLMTGSLNLYSSLISDKNKAIPELITGLSPAKDSTSEPSGSSDTSSAFMYETSFDASTTTRQNDYIFVELPYFNDGFESWHIQALNSKRNNPFYIPFPIKESYILSIHLPKNSSFINKDTIISVKNEIGFTDIFIHHTKKEVEVSRILIIKNQFIDVKDYEKLKELLIPWLDKNNKILVFKMGCQSKN